MEKILQKLKDVFYRLYVFFTFLGGGLFFRIQKNQKPKANVILLSGVLLNSLTLRPMGSFLSKRGYNVLIPRLGWNIEKTEQKAKKLNDLMEKQKINSNLPLYVIGYSMGGLVAHYWIKNYGIKITKLITLGTPFLGSKVIKHRLWFFLPAAYSLTSKTQIPDYVVMDKNLPQINVAADDDILVEQVSALLPEKKHYVFHNLGGHSALQMHRKVFEKMAEWF